MMIQKTFLVLIALVIVTYGIVGRAQTGTAGWALTLFSIPSMLYIWIYFADLYDYYIVKKSKRRNNIRNKFSNQKGD